MTIIRALVGVGLVLALTVILVTCGTADEPSNSTPLPTGHPVVDDATLGAMQAGQQLFIDVGCAGCHGVDGLGLSAPHLMGHSPEVITMIVRDPVADMPAYSHANLSDAELALIADYVAGLRGDRAEVERRVQRGRTHQYLAVVAIEAGDIERARYYAEGAIRFGHDPDRLIELHTALDALAAGNPFRAQALLEADLDDFDTAGKSQAELHLELAVLALRDLDGAEGAHELEIFAELAESDRDRAEASESLDLIEAGDLDHAEFVASELLLLRLQRAREP